MNENSLALSKSSRPLWKSILLFSLPVAATSILEQLFNASDVAIVGSFASVGKTQAVAAVGANGPLISLIVNFFIGIALGANVVIAKAYGQGNHKKIHQTVATSILMALIGGILTTILGEFVISSVLSLMGVPDDVFTLALSYMQIYLLGLPAILLYNFESAIFRSIGQTKIPLYVLAFSGLLNIIGNLFFVIALHLTVEGVAISTVLSNLVSGLILFVWLLKTKDVIHVDLKHLKIHSKIMGEVLKIGIPAGLQSSVFAISNIVIQTAINSLGTLVMAASTAAYNLEILCYDVVNAFTQACTTYTSQNYGAGGYRECRKVLWTSMALSAGCTVLMVLLVLVAGKPLLSLFNSDPQVIDLGYIRLLIIFCGYLFCVIYECFSGYLRGFGISLTPALLTIVGICVIRVFWVYTVFASDPTFSTLLLSYPVTMGVTALLMSVAAFLLHPAQWHLQKEEQKVSGSSQNISHSLFSKHPHFHHPAHMA